MLTSAYLILWREVISIAWFRHTPWVEIWSPEAVSKRLERYASVTGDNTASTVKRTWAVARIRFFPRFLGGIYILAVKLQKIH